MWIHSQSTLVRFMRCTKLWDRGREKTYDVVGATSGMLWNTWSYCATAITVVLVLTHPPTPKYLQGSQLLHISLGTTAFIGNQYTSDTYCSGSECQAEESAAVLGSDELHIWSKNKLKLVSYPLIICGFTTHKGSYKVRSGWSTTRFHVCFTIPPSCLQKLKIWLGEFRTVWISPKCSRNCVYRFHNS